MYLDLVLLACIQIKYSGKICDNVKMLMLLPAIRICVSFILTKTVPTKFCKSRKKKHPGPLLICLNEKKKSFFNQKIGDESSSKGPESKDQYISTTAREGRTVRIARVPQMNGNDNIYEEVVCGPPLTILLVYKKLDNQGAHTTKKQTEQTKQTKKT